MKSRRGRQTWREFGAAQSILWGPWIGVSHWCPSLTSADNRGWQCWCRRACLPSGDSLTTSSSGIWSSCHSWRKLSCAAGFADKSGVCALPRSPCLERAGFVVLSVSVGISRLLASSEYYPEEAKASLGESLSRSLNLKVPCLPVFFFFSTFQSLVCVLCFVLRD